MTRATTRRDVLRGIAALTASGGGRSSVRAAQSEPATPPGGQSGFEVVVSVNSESSHSPPFDRNGFGIVGVYDGDWFDQAGFSQMLDNLAASPHAFHGVRFFGIFTAGQPERYLPEDPGTIWPSVDAPMDFSAAFDALAELTSRGLVPVLPFGFFPPAISASMLQPPVDWTDYKALVRAFLIGLADDSRFGPEAIANWWFEAWNEPNEGRFWSGTMDEYFDLYRATSEAITDTGLSIRFGGPAIAYKPQVSPADGAPWMEQFIRRLADDPELQCDFISYHRKGTVTDDPPDPRLMYEAATTTADQLRSIDADRFAGMVIVNDEADEKVGFEHPYAPRLDERNAAWLSTVVAIHGGLTEQYAEEGYRFFGAADNANLQLVEAPFDGRRSIMTYARDQETDLLKLPAYAYYELLPLLGDHLASLSTGQTHLFPETDLYHLTAWAATHIGSLLTCYPDPNQEQQAPRFVDLTIAHIPWNRVNVAQFLINHHHSNAYAAAGGSNSNPFPVPDPSDLAEIRRAQELAVARPIEHNIPLRGGVYRQSVELGPYTTALLWLTPVDETPPKAQEWISITVQAGNVVLRWTPSLEPSFYSYEVFLVRDDEVGPRITPIPLRSALWIDTAPPAGRRRYGLRSVSASGIFNELVISEEIEVS